MKPTQSITLALLLSIFLLDACQKDEVKIQEDTTPTVTEKGTPIGSATTATIGANGGTLTTPDGTLTLTIPAGALSTNVTISAQPISNTAPGGSGVAYRLAPEGQKFEKPISLTFKYKDEDFDGSTPELGWVITQESDDTWSGHPNTKRDLINKTLKVESTHFSDWGYGTLAEMKLEDGDVVIEAGGKQRFFVLVGYTSQAEIERSLKDEPPSSEAPLPRLKLPKAGQGIEFRELDLNSNNVFWELNGKKAPVTDNGIGNLQAFNDEGKIAAIYTSPEKAPTPNKVGLNLRIAGNLLTVQIIIVELGITLNVDGETIIIKNSGKGIDASELRGNVLILRGSDVDDKVNFSLNIYDPKLGGNIIGVSSGNFSRKAEVEPYSHVDYQCTPRTGGGGKNCNCVGNNTRLPNWNVTITSLPKQEERRSSCFDGKPKQGILVKGTFIGTLGKRETKNGCTTTKKVNFTGSFEFLYNCDSL
jgi:hypothetical protein